MKTVHLIISGKVQGVFFRATAKKKADQLLLNGWVKNIPGNKVEIVVSGESEAIKKFITWSQSGPPNALVKKVVVNEIVPQVFTSFRIIK